MVLYPFSNQTIDVNEFCIYVVDNFYEMNISFCCIEDLHDHFTGKINNDIFINLIKASFKSIELSPFLVSVIEYAEPNDINEEIFKLITNFPKNGIRKEILIALSHKALTENQLLFLCEKAITFESFFELSILYYTHAIYSVNDLIHSLQILKNSQFHYMEKDVLNELLKKWKASNHCKEEYIKSLYS